MKAPGGREGRKGVGRRGQGGAEGGVEREEKRGGRRWLQQGEVPLLGTQNGIFHSGPE